MEYVSRTQLHDIISRYIRDHVKNGADQILEAGCGRYWLFNLEDIEYTLTGVDLDRDALEVRKEKDLDIAIFGDLRTVELAPRSFDIIYNSFVLEHVDGAQAVLENFVTWLKPGGLLILLFPNRNSVYGFFTRITPLWVHVAYKRYIKGNKSAGKPGCAPYPTYYDEILTRSAFLDFAKEHQLSMKEEAYFGKEPALVRLFMKVVEIMTLGRLSASAQSLLFILEKPLDLAESTDS